MCELHFYKCACGARWTFAKRLSSCEDEGMKCPDSLCMHVGNPRKPQKRECEGCRLVREMMESLEEEEEEVDGNCNIVGGDMGGGNTGGDGR